MVFKFPCSCGKHIFVFAKKPWCETKVKCPICKKINIFDPNIKEKPKKLKESDK